MDRLKREARQLRRYGAVGLATNLSLYVLFLVLLRLGVEAVPATGLCYVLGVMLSYTLNRTWSFESRDSHRRDLTKFLLAYVTGFFSTLITMDILLHWLRPATAQIGNVVLTAVIIYASLRLLRFGGSNC